MSKSLDCLNINEVDTYSLLALSIGIDAVIHQE